MGLIKKSNLIEKGTFFVKESVPSVKFPNEENELPEIEIPHELTPEYGGSKEEMATYAKGEAEGIVRKAMEEAEAIKEQAREAGLEDARRMAEEGASDKVKEALEVINQAVIERKKIIKDAESEVLRLALKVAEQIIRSEVSLHRDVSLNIVSDAISRVSDREQVIIKVNREDVENVKKI